MKAKLDFFDEDYNDESNLIENLYEFHPEFFKVLSAKEFATLQEYYLFATSTTNFPKNIFAYRRKLLQNNPTLEGKAKNIYNKLLLAAGIED